MANQGLHGSSWLQGWVLVLFAFLKSMAHCPDWPSVRETFCDPCGFRDLGVWWSLWKQAIGKNRTAELFCCSQYLVWHVSSRLFPTVPQREGAKGMFILLSARPCAPAVTYLFLFTPHHGFIREALLSSFWGRNQCCSCVSITCLVSDDLSAGLMIDFSDVFLPGKVRVRKKGSNDPRTD